MDLFDAVKGMEKSVAAKQSTAKNPVAPYYVENQGQAIGPFQTAKAAARRAHTETQRWKQAGGRGKRPELLQYKYSETPPRNPKTKVKIPRVSPDRRKSPEDSAWDYVYKQPVWKNTVKQNVAEIKSGKG